MFILPYVLNLQSATPDPDPSPGGLNGFFFLGFPAFDNIEGDDPEPGVRVPLEKALAAYLAGDAAILAIVGTRVYLGRIPQRDRSTTPSLVYRVVSRVPAYDLDGDSGFVRARVQIDAVASNAVEAEALNFAVRSACARIPAEMEGLEVAAKWVDAGVTDDDDLPTGSDSTRAAYRLDLMIHYREQPV